MKKLFQALFLIAGIMLVGCSEENPSPGVAEIPTAEPEEGELWRAVHLLGYSNDQDLEELGQDLPKLAEMGINTIVLEVDYSFEFESHPELRYGDSQISKEGARKFVELAREHGIQIIPQFQSLGHQSWDDETYSLLTVYPDLDLTPGAFPNNEGLYTREWDVMNPRVYEIVTPLMDEIIDAFDAKYFHVGMDEVFLLGSDESPSTKGQDPGMLFAKAVNDLHAHLTGKRGVQMIMWGDRLIDGEKYPHGRWESSMNGTHTAVDMIPKDIIIAPWHYNLREDGYPSIPMFLEKGFRVLPASWNKPDATQALINYSLEQNDPKMMGHLFTLWGRRDTLTAWDPMVQGLPLLQQKDQE